MKIHFSLVVGLMFTMMMTQLAPVHAATLKGKITDEAGISLPFANVYIKNTSIGTTSNEDGFYQLELEAGSYEVVFQYVGYQIREEVITISNTAKIVNVSLQPSEVQLDEVVVYAGEDPAYRIIRAAIQKRKYYEKQAPDYQCETYVKGVQKIKETPKMLMGIPVENLGGLVDTTGQGILYLSESVSELYRQNGDFREVMVSSKVSGNDNGFSFNRASTLNFNFYKNTINLNRALVSPIAFNALKYYKYRLEGYFFENGAKVNKIRVIPKNAYAPTFSGYIYIVEDLWNIYTIDLKTTRAATQIPLLDTFYIRQVFVPIQQPDVWMPISSQLTIEFSILGFKIEGYFMGSFKDYKLGVPPPSFSKNEVLKIEEGANERVLSYWDSIRPVPLTAEEQWDYIKKDSINAIVTSKAYRDSMDRRTNKFSFFDAIAGYTFSNTHQQRYFKLAPLINTVQFNLVQGFRAGTGVTYEQYFDREQTQHLVLSNATQYGFSDRRMRTQFAATYQFNAINFRKITVEGGNNLQQFNENNPICDWCNTSHNLIYRLNWVRLYDQNFLKLGYEQEVFNGVFFRGSAAYSHRKPVENTTDFHILNPFGYDSYRPNTPNHPAGQISEHRALLLSASVRLRFQQEFIRYPKQKVARPSKYPEVWLHYRKGISMDASESVDFDWVKVSIAHTQSLGVWGISRWRLEGGAFLNRTAVTFPDFFHFNGNQTLVKKLERYGNSFFMLPYYERSTDNAFVLLHYEHDFNGKILSKVPLLKKTGWTLVTGGNAFYTPENGGYYEAFLGLNQVGFSLFRWFRADVAVGFDHEQILRTRVVFGYDFPIF